MKIKPVITEHIHTSHTSFLVDFALPYNVVFVVGDSGEGKSAVFSFLEEMGSEEKWLKCFNYLDSKKGYRNSIKRSKGKLFVIDNADVLLDDGMRQFISVDEKNQYLIFGRNPTGLLLVQDNIFELTHTKEEGKTVFRLRKAF